MSSTIATKKKNPCRFKGCTKINAGGGFCIAHGGGKKCQYPDCTKGSQRWGFCRAHGGGSKCTFVFTGENKANSSFCSLNSKGLLECDKVDAGGGFCRAHGGGKRCQQANCNKADVGGGFCTLHGGGTKCSVEGCLKNDQGGGKCRAHGGGRRCKMDGCQKTVQGNNGRCGSHGGKLKCRASKCRRLVHSSAIGNGKKNSGYCKRHFDELQPANLVNIIQEDSILSETEDRVNPKESCCAASGINNHNESGSKFDLDKSMGVCVNNGCSRCFGGSCNCINCLCGGSCCAKSNQKKTFPPPSTPSTVLPPTSSENTKIIATVEVTEASPTQVRKSNNSLDLTPVSMSKKTYKMVNIRVTQANNPNFKQTWQIERVLLRDPDVHRVTTICSDGDEHSSNNVIVLEIVGLMVDGQESELISAALKSLIPAIDQQLVILECMPLIVPVQEIVVQVPEMMCMGNCGKTVDNILHTLSGVQNVNILFDQRLVVVYGRIESNWIIDIIASVGFQAIIESCTTQLQQEPLLFQVDHKPAMKSIIKSWLALGQAIESKVSSSIPVTQTSFLFKSKQLIVTPQNSTTTISDILDCLHLDFPFLQITPIPFSSTIAHPKIGHSAVSNNSCCSKKEKITTTGHVCSTEVCFRNGCEKYIATMAHTAALAGGLVVPGCAMSWGGDCSCGDDCKCVGCPTHHPKTK